MGAFHATYTWRIFAPGVKLHGVQKEMSLREQKRIATRASIEDAATRLVDERGFSAVTVEEICQEAGISRRTFFNYFDSKDSAVLGSPSMAFPEEVKAAYLESEEEDVFELTVQLVVSMMGNHHANQEIAMRRRRIALDPDAAVAAHGRKIARSEEIFQLITQKLEKHPSLRRLPHLRTKTEATVIAGIIRESVWLALSSEDIDFSADFEPRLRQALNVFSEFLKGNA